MDFKFNFLKSFSTTIKPGNSTENTHDLLIKAGRTLYKKRKEYGMTRSELAHKTKISAPVIEAIEKGWLNKLPESAYLCSMLLLLENELNLEKNVLKDILKSSQEQESYRELNELERRGFDIFNTWYGSLLYIITILSSLLIINKQQEHIAKINSSTFNPIPANINLLPLNPISTKNSLTENQKLDSNTERLSSKNKLFRFFARFTAKPKPRQLEIKLITPRKVKIINANGDELNITSAKGIIKIKLLPPVQVEISPPLNSSEPIIWNNKINYIPKEDNNGIYLLDEVSNN